MRRNKPFTYYEKFSRQIKRRLKKRFEKRIEKEYYDKDINEVKHELLYLNTFDESRLLNLFIVNKLKRGEISKLDKVFFELLKNLKQDEVFIGESPMSIFFKLVYGLKFNVRFLKHRKSGRIYKIPVLLSYYTSYLAGLKLFFLELNKRGRIKDSYIYRVYFEVKNIVLNKQSNYVEHRDELYKEVLKSRANLRFLK